MKPRRIAPNKYLFLVALALLFVLSGCMTTTYRLAQPEIALHGAAKTVRHCLTETTEHYFLMGFIAATDERQITEACVLKPREALMNGAVTNKQGVLDATYTFLGSLLTFGVVNPIIWTTRTSVIEGDVVELPAN